jgi:uncharacterized membrane-anchored protein
MTREQTRAWEGYSEQIERARNEIARQQLAGFVGGVAARHWGNALLLAEVILQEWAVAAGECALLAAAQEQLHERLRQVEAHRAELLRELEGNRESVE